MIHSQTGNQRDKQVIKRLEERGKDRERERERETEREREREGETERERGGRENIER